jgi:hypothetical protein
VAAGVAWAEGIKRGWLAETAILIVVAGAVFLAVPATRIEPSVNATVPTPEQIRKRILSGTAADEYLPRDVRSVPRRPAEDVPANRDVHAVAVSRSPIAQRLRLDVQRAGTLELPLHAFPGWKVREATGPAKVTLGTSQRGLLELAFRERGDYTLTVHFGSTPARTLALGLSLLGLLGVFPVAHLLSSLARQRRPRRLASAPPLEGLPA